MIEFKNVSFSYESKAKEHTIKDVSFKIEKGEFVSVIGSNGAGKSTVSKLINGLLKPSSGDVIISGTNIKTVPASRLSKEVGFLFQNPDRQICCDTIKKELSFGLKLAGISEEETEARVMEVIQDFGFEPDTNPFLISRGERQRVALASLIALRPEIIILDEPTTGLDYNECTHIMEKVKELNSGGVTVFMVCHDMELVLDYSERILVMSDGKIICDSAPHDAFRNQDAMKSACIIPPQIIELGLRLKNGFENADTTDEMASLIAERRNA